MKFQVRAGFVASITSVVKLLNGREELRVNTYREGETFDCTAEQAADQAHKVEPLDAEAAAYLDSRVAVPPPLQGEALSPAALATIQAIATTMAGTFAAALAGAQANAAAAADTGSAASKPAKA